MEIQESISKVGTAEFFGVTTQSLDRWIAQGCPVAERDRSGNVKAMNLRDVAQWRVARAQDKRDKVNRSLETVRVDDDMLKSFACEILVPCVFHDMLYRINVIAKASGVTRDEAMAVWGTALLLSYDSIQRLFGLKEDPAFKLTEFVMEGLKESGDQERAKRKSKSARHEPAKVA